MKTRAHLCVSGRVQGVCFRANTRDWALANNVSGWVRNLLDGRVEAVLEGEEEDVKKVVGLVKKGPASAFVKEVRMNWEDYQGEFKEFEVRYF
ncbi:acylphosphatase [bacterium]|nr:acylphosphatase [bacterium]MBU1614614.1 acylphosphatase [bacterium]